MSARVLYAFDHIPKCAGSSVDSIIADNVAGYVRIDGISDLLRNVKRINEDEESAVQYIGGHNIYGIHELVPRDYKTVYFTFLRDPIRLAYSWYKFTKKRGGAVYGSFCDYLYDNQFNRLTDYLGGTYERAVARLENYEFVGFVEHFSSSMQQLSGLLGFDLTSWHYKNKTVTSTEELNSITLSSLAEGSDDYQIYSYFLNGFDPSKIIHTQQDDKHASVEFSKGNEISTQWIDNEIDAKSLVERIKTEQDGHLFYQSITLACKLGIDIDDDVFQRIVDVNPEYVLSGVNGSQIDTKERFDAIYEFYKKLQSHNVHSRQSIVLSKSQEILLSLARTKYAQANSLSSDLYQQAIRLNRYDYSCNTAYAVYLRSQLLFDEALEVLDSIPQNQRSTSFVNEHLVTSMAKEGAAFNLDDFIKENDPAAHYKSLEFIRSNFELAGRVLLTCIHGKKVLIVRSGPKLLLDDLVAELRDTPVQLSLMLQEGLRGDALAGEYPCHFISDGYFSPSGTFEGSDELLSQEYDCIIYLCSSYDSLNSLHNFMEYLNQLQCPQSYAYPISNLFCPSEGKSLIPVL